jgi:hypothetical protein
LCGCSTAAFESIGVIPNTTSAPVLSNVAIASAVTAYGRIIMMPVKNEFCCYSDTDSVITTVPLPSHMMGDELGLFKDELNGSIISKGVFLGIKQYGYIIGDKEKSVFAGVPRNTIKYTELEYLANGGSLNKPVNDKFFKSLKTLKMKIMHSSIIIKANNKKILKDNRYYPIHVNLPYIDSLNDVRLHSKITRIFKRIILLINNCLKKWFTS